MDGIRAETERVRLERQKKNAANQHSEPSGNKFPEGSTKKKGSSSTKTATKVAKVFNTNERYVKDAAKLKKEDPSAHARSPEGLPRYPFYYQAPLEPSAQSIVHMLQVSPFPVLPGPGSFP